MSWTVTASPRFDKAIKTLDRATAMRIFKTLYALANLDEPANRCKALTGPLVGLWRLRVGDWRILLDIRRNEMTLIALDVGHRSKIYD